MYGHQLQSANIVPSSRKTSKPLETLSVSLLFTQSPFLLLRKTQLKS
eukprot:Gb_04037 [translate_table: standard]